jgi:peptidoglycan/LPS O-acetylase OafA/YrhL
VPRKLKITLWVAIGLVVAALVVIMSPLEMVIMSTLMKQGIELPLPLAPFYVFFTMIFVCGVLIVHWTHKNIKQKTLRRYLFLAGASALGVLFFQVVVHRFSEVGMVMAVLVCPTALIVGVALALRFKTTSVA